MFIFKRHTVYCYHNLLSVETLDWPL